ncbi:hypothetical protein M404DRAFT_809890 [Pisolithus tinctorius Marx 270]|uniref:Uncharacterized protein n=1 Tax=Pisolithus tinctorius Marx 270 TaxID=870435 RepID=A0A0C3NW84_PISTI|nr:hypothetical protein M404DRAFT_809890 [Pisolithus tinctorius Marx 270]
MSEKVEPSAFSSGSRVSAMIRDMEDIYVARFAKGDRRTAMKRLRPDSRLTSHHMSVFRSGMYLGLAVAAFAAGIYQCTCPPLWGFTHVEHPVRFSATYKRKSSFVECSSVHIRDIWDACLTRAAGRCEC